MSSDLVFEVLCEQLPIKTTETASEYILPRISKGFSAKGIKYDTAKTLTTPHRIIFIAHNITLEGVGGTKEVKGPKVSSDEKSINGFLKKVKKNSIEELEVREISGEKFYYSSTTNGTLDISSEVTEVIQDMINNFPLHKRMRWGSGVEHWVRPVINVLCVVNDKVLPVSVAGVQANNLTYGNLRFSRNSHTVTTIDDYLGFLSKNMVIADEEERENFIIKQLDEVISGTDLKYDLSDQVLRDLVSNLEYPKILIGEVRGDLQEIPGEVVSCVLTRHQRYLAIKSQSGKIVKFASVASVVNNRAVKTHETVLRARLSDALFLIKKDKEYSIDHYIELLSIIVFKSGLGTLLDKVERMSALAKYCSIWIPRSSMLSAERASMVSKADLATLIVKEFPELQGKIGRYYASYHGESEEVCLAIEEHYLPVNPKDPCPSSPTGIAVSISDKVDSLVGLMAIEKISGSRDPFALRRTAISLLRVILENNICIPLDLIVSKAVSLYSCGARKNKDENFFLRVDKDIITSIVLSFCYERLKVILRDGGLDKEVIDAVVGSIHDVSLVKKKVEVVCSFLKTDKGKETLTSYRRAYNIVSKENISDISNAKCSPKLFVEDSEVSLYNQVKDYKKLLGGLIKENNFVEVMESLFRFSASVSSFMDGVRVCDYKNKELYRNRIGLLAFSINIYHMMLDFSKIPRDS
ncbi:glycine--tRNA ligase subunit beta [Anaplasma capra]|uniref:glycine--tRNA ligase subunit beta n=1 Tax=Anaplasma capra TaxID=1562740 RepID=UPI0021D59305|nr:glycine--tRNA ligase subunit beta [Anaplasma capra]MCU7611185.1 glycine--tRNA ligase subunit beta [Anaplasma capra]